jgi:O-acetyl-ADP-ribose deacetylase (regulator of RNase III)
MVEPCRGDLLWADAEALVNTVNTVGVMGKGLALQFRQAYPAMFRAYREACDIGQIKTGSMWVWSTGRSANPRLIVNFPTKRHWRAPSRMEYIETGLIDLARVIRQHAITSIAVPPLGVGLGGLPWPPVRHAITRALGSVAGVRVLLYEPW